MNVNRLATRTKMFTMGPKTQRNLSFSSKTIEKVYRRRRQYPFKKKRIAGLLIESCGQLGKISQPIHVQWIRRPDYNEKTLRYRKSIGLPPGQKCSRWVRRHNGISLSPARLLRKVYQPLGVASIPFKKFFFSFTRGQMTQEINNTKLVDNDKVYCINRLPPEGLLDHW